MSMKDLIRKYLKKDESQIEPFVFQPGRCIPGSEDYIVIVTDKSVYKGIDICTIKQGFNKQYLDTLVPPVFRQVEDNVYESDFKTVVIADGAAYEIGDGKKLSHLDFLKELADK
jgi:hypothetical protein